MLEDETSDIFEGLPEEEPVIETLESSLDEEKTEEEEPSQDGDKPEEAGNSPDEDNVPFHKHPRWIEREDNHNKKIDNLQAEIDGLKQSTQPPADPAVPQEFTELFGTDVPAGTFGKFNPTTFTTAAGMDLCFNHIPAGASFFV